MENKSDKVNPNHYKNSQFETIDEMLIIFGVDAVISYCKITAWKYRARAMFKGEFETDMKKADWYISKTRELQVTAQQSESEYSILHNVTKKYD